MSETTDLQAGSGQRGWQPGLESGSTSTAAGQSLIGPTVVIRGELVAEEDLLVKGRVEGFIDHSSTVTVHAEGTVAAEIKAQEVLIEGTVDGNVYGTRRVQIAESGTVNGNVYAPRVGVLEGASFKGAVDMDADVEAIERRFREKTGTEMSPPAVEKTAAAKGTADQEKEKADAAQADGKGNRDESAASADAGD
jgi:cytoskeletal protein CcmA (bactofilin family)